MRGRAQYEPIGPWRPSVSTNTTAAVKKSTRAPKSFDFVGDWRPQLTQSAADDDVVIKSPPIAQCKVTQKKKRVREHKRKMVFEPIQWTTSSASQADRLLPAAPLRNQPAKRTRPVQPDCCDVTKSVLWQRPFDLLQSADNKDEQDDDDDDDQIEIVRPSKPQVIPQQPPQRAPVPKLRAVDLSLLDRRHCPKSLDDLIDRHEAVEEMRDWLRCFQVHRPRSTRRALLIVGPTGVGKSTAGRLLLHEFGLRAYEYANGDMVQHEAIQRKRNKYNHYGVFSPHGVSEVIYKIASRSAVFEQFGLLLEDVGTISASAQKALVEVISGKRHARLFKKEPNRVWHAPIVATCDIDNLSRIRSLSRLCQVVSFDRVAAEHLLPLLNEVCATEHITIPPALAKRMTESCNGDVRKLFTSVQLLALQPVIRDRNEGVDLVGLSFDLEDDMQYLLTFLRNKGDGPTNSEHLTSLHPIKLYHLLHENHPRIIAHGTSNTKRQRGANHQAADLLALEQMVQVTDLASFSRIFHDQVYQEMNWELQEVCHTLMTWGLGVHIPTPNAGWQGTKMRKPFFYSFDKKQWHREKRIRTLDPMDRDVLFIDKACVLSEYIDQHHEQPSNTAVELLQERKYNYKDAQDVWKCAHMAAVDDKPKTMPNPRGALSLRKLLQ